MNITEHDTKLYNDSIKKIKSNNYEIDSLIDSVSDKHHGIALLIRPNLIVRDNIQSFPNDLRNLESQHCNTFIKIC